VDPILGPEMKSTGEVMGIDEEFGKYLENRSLPRVSGCQKKVPSSSA